MSDTTVNAGSETAPVAKTFKSLADVERIYFAPSDIETKGMETLKAIMTIPNISDAIAFNGTWSTDGNFPESHGLFILPVGETVPVMVDVKNADGTVTQVPSKTDKHRVTKAVVVAAVPTLDALNTSDAGKAFVWDGVVAQFATKLRNSALRAEDLGKATLPFSVDEFIEKSERGAADQGLRSYKELAPIFVKALGKKNITTNAQLLREMLQSSKFAEALMPNVKQVVWVKTLEAMKEYAASAEAVKKFGSALSVTIFDHWLATRDQAQVEVAVDDIDFDTAA
jgi:hypothetical protein